MLKGNKFKKLLNILLIFFSGIVLFTSVILITYILFSKIPPNFTKLNKKDLFRKIPKAFVIQSGSMEPVIKTGSVVVTILQKSYVQNDIVTFALDGNFQKLVTHRIITKLYPQGLENSPKYITGGDANEEFDSWEVKDEYIIGKVVLIIPYLGYFADFAKKPQGFVLLVVVPATIIIYEELKTIFREVRNLISNLVRKKKENKVFIFPTVKRDKNFSLNLRGLIPIITSFIFLLSFSLAYFADIEKSIGNVLGASSSFGEKKADIYQSNGYSCSEGATQKTNDLGNIFIKVSDSKVRISIFLQGSLPSTTFDIWVNQEPGGCPLSSSTLTNAFTTDSSGNASYYLEIQQIPGSSNFWMSLVSGDYILRSSAVSF